MLEDIIVLEVIQLPLALQHPRLAELNPCQIVFEVLTEFIENCEPLSHSVLVLLK